MKILTVIGTRPEIIRLSQVIGRLDQLAQHVLVHTGQNFDDRLNGIFFREMKIRRPDVCFGIRQSSFSEQAGQILMDCERLFLQEKPDKILILGDTNSGLSAIVAKRLGIPVYHMEAGNRCYDDRVPEETNRRIIDQCSSVLMPYTHKSKENLLREGFSSDRIYVTGNPIKEVMDFYKEQIDKADVMSRLSLDDKKFLLVTMHRAENVDNEERLTKILRALKELRHLYGFPIICSLHPRTRAKAGEYGIDLERYKIRCVKPLGFFDFIALEKSAFCILSDSGTVQEEACILGIPNVTIRDATERPETLECGSNMLAGCEPRRIIESVRCVVEGSNQWTPPSEYLKNHVASTIVRIVMGFRPADRAEIDWRKKQASPDRRKVPVRHQ
jgi:UDP-N-acetylglucosamine 2-epimerase (non-hydrolysing)